MKIGIFHIFLFLLMACLLLENLFPSFRYLKYLLPFGALFIYLIVDRLKLNKQYFNYFNAFFSFYLIVIVFLLLRLLFLREWQPRFTSNALFILMPLTLIFILSAFYNSARKDEYVKFSFFVIVLIFLLKEGPHLFMVLTHFDLLKEAVLSSKMKTENQLAFSLGFFLFYFIVEKYPKKYILFCALIFILSFKRIALAAFIVSYLFYVLAKYVRFHSEKNKNIIWGTAALLNLLFVKLVFLIVHGDLDQVIRQYTDFSTNRLLMGRQTYYTVLTRETGDISWSGLGLGKVDQILYDAFGEQQNLHSDILKNYFQFGAILFFVWLVLLFYRTSFSNKALSILIYFNILMFTDNVFIYFDFMFFFYFFVLIYLSEKYGSVKNPDTLLANA